MAANVFRVILRDWKTCVRWSYGRRQLSQTQGPPDNPSFVESVDEYQFVERLLPPTKIPEPPKHKHYPTPSGWQPPRDPLPSLPYFVRRSRMHNIPVYKEITHGNRQMTLIRKVEGDIWVSGLGVCLISSRAEGVGSCNKKLVTRVYLSPGSTEGRGRIFDPTAGKDACHSG